MGYQQSSNKVIFLYTWFPGTNIQTGRLIVVISSLPRNIAAIVPARTINHLGKKSSMTCATSGTRPVFRSRAPDFTPGFSEVCVAQYLVVCVVFCRSLFVLQSFFCPLYSLSSNLLLLITHVVSSNLSQVGRGTVHTRGGTTVFVYQRLPALVQNTY